MELKRRDARKLKVIIKYTIRNYNKAPLAKKMQMKMLLQGIQKEYPLTFTCVTEPALLPKEVITRLHKMVIAKITTPYHIENDPMYGNLTHDLL